MGDLGCYLQDLGALSLPAFADYVNEILGREAGQQVLRAQQLLARRPNAPAHWKKDIERYIRSAREAVAESRLSVPSDLPGTDVEKKTFLQERVRRYGALLACWPALVEAASDLQRKGHFADKI